MISEDRKRLWFVLGLLLSLSACAGQVVEYAIPDPIFRQMMDYEIAREIAENCDRYEVIISPEEKRKELEQSLRLAHFREDEIDTRLERARAERGDAYLNAYTRVIPVRQDFCAMGDYEVKRQSSVGLLLQAA